jgi:hypothetical protein
MRSDKKKSLSKVAKAILSNPLMNEREIAEKASVSNWTAHNMIKELEQTWAKDDRIVWLTDEDFVIMKRIQEVKKQRLNKPEEVNNSDIDKWEQTATKRYSLFRWDATDKDWGLKNIESIEIL